MDYPTLSINPEYPYVITYEDSTIRSDFEGGYEITRNRYTRFRRVINVNYKYMSSTDFTTLNNFYNSVRCTASFNFTCPVTSTVYNVRFAEPINAEYVSYGYYNVSFKLKEV